MKTILKKTLTFLLLVSISFSSIAFAVTGPAPVCLSTPHLGFTNGIQNTSEQAVHSLVILRQHAKARGMVSPSNKDVSDYVFYHQKGINGTESRITSFLLDVMEVYWQLAQATVNNDPAKEQQAMQLFFKTVLPSSSDASTSGMLANMLQFLTQAQNERIALTMYTGIGGTLLDTTAKDVAKLYSILSKGDTLMMAAHSQGTLSANAALQEFAKQYPQFASQVRLASAGMAAPNVWQTPGSIVANTYVTNTNDLVIDTIRDLARSKSLAPSAVANATHPVALFADITGHDFTKIYLDESAETGTKFMQIFSNGYTQLLKENSAKVFVADLTYTVDFSRTRWTPENRISGPDGFGFTTSISQTQLSPTTIREVYSLSCGGNSTTPILKSYDFTFFLGGLSNPDAVVSVAGTITMSAVTYPVTKLGLVNSPIGGIPGAGTIRLTGTTGTPAYTATLSIF